MAKSLTKTLYIKLLRDVKAFLQSHVQNTKNKNFIKMLDELALIVSQGEEDMTKWKLSCVALLEKLNHIYQRIRYDRWFHAYGTGVALRDGLDHIFQNTLGIQPDIGYFSTHLMPMSHMDIAVGRYVKSYV